MLPASPHGRTGSLLVAVWPLTVLSWLSLDSAGFISMLSVMNPVLRLYLGVFGHAGLISRCSKSSILLFFRSSNSDLFLDTFWSHVRFLFVAKHISGAHLSALAGPLSLLLFPLMLSGIRKGSLLALLSLFIPSWVRSAALGASF